MGMSPEEQAWRARAHCVGAGHLFYPDLYERKTQREDRERQARSICARCPVLVECRTYARAHREMGFWGGESEDERSWAGFPPPQSSYRKRIQPIDRAE